MLEWVQLPEYNVFRDIYADTGENYTITHNQKQDRISLLLDLNSIQP
jgi:hypothetical protein